MSHVRDDLGRRIELVSMDRHCDEVSVALYARAGARIALVHSYSERPRVAERLAWIAGAMRTLAGLTGTGPALSFPCLGWHESAARRVFLEACRLDPAQPLASRPLQAFDDRSGQELAVVALGRGAYRVLAGVVPATADRASAVARGLARLAELDVDPSDGSVVRFACGAPHDELVGLLLSRAMNIRGALRELAAAAARGVLAPPGAQEPAV